MAKAATKTKSAKKTATKKPTKKAASKTGVNKSKTAVDKTPEELSADADALIAASETEPAAPKVLTHRLNMDDIDVKRMIASAKKSGLITTKELYKHIKIEGITAEDIEITLAQLSDCLLYTSPSPRDLSTSRMPSSA